MCCLYTATSTPSFCRFWHGHPYIPLHFLKMFYILVAKEGLKGLVEQELQWIFWTWCLAHRLEPAVQDAMKGTVFDSIDTMLLKLYYLYAKLPKKCRELEEVTSDVAEYISYDDKGVRPVHVSGSQWISHKINAMQRIISIFGAYTMHLISLSQDCTVRSSDSAKLHGYCMQ